MFSTLHEAEAFFHNRRELGIKPGLERIHKLLEFLNHPEKKMKAIHVAGTNGKGSTIQFINAALQASNLDTGIFTSPSFSGLTGHIFLNDEAITESEFVALLNEMYPYIEKMDEMEMAPTEFEILTALSFLYFSKNGDVILVETGMGGRFDTTNSFLPILSIITNVSIDHTGFLGETAKDIAFHKAGIIKQGIPVIIGEMDESALDVMKEEAKINGSESYILGKDFSFNKKKGFQEIKWLSSENELYVSLSMQGEHQLKNVSLALKALEILEKQNIQINWSEALQAIEKTIAPGRFEIVHQNPLVVADAAHNPDGVEALIDTANKMLPNEKKHVIIGMFKDKDTEKMLQRLGENFDEVTLTSFNHPRAADAKDLFEKTPSVQKRIEKDWKHAIQVALEKNQACFITGSLHFITMVRQHFHEKGSIM